MGKRLIGVLQVVRELVEGTVCLDMKRFRTRKSSRGRPAPQKKISKLPAGLANLCGNFPK